MTAFYAYMWLREDGTPYYIGKGKGKRAFVNHPDRSVYRPVDDTRILVFLRCSEQEALETEIELIRNWGRKDNGTGILRNRTDGGDGVSGWVPSEATREKWRTQRKGQQRALGSVRRGEKRKGFGPEARRRMSEGQRGKKMRSGWRHSEETRLKMRIAARTRKQREI